MVKRKLTRGIYQGEIDALSAIPRMNVGMTHARRTLLPMGDSFKLCSHPVFVGLLAYLKGVWGAIGQHWRWIEMANYA